MATSAITPPSAGSTLPTPPSTSDPVNFDARADAFFSALPGLQTSENLLKDNVYANAVVAYQNALQTATDSAAAQTAAATAQTYMGAIAWVSGTTYAIGDVRWSPGNGRVYRRITNGAGTTDPYNDPTNWRLVPTSIPITHLTSALVTQASSGMFYEFANSTTQGAATNLLRYSSAFDNGAWSKWHTSITANNTMDPTGATGADKLVENADTYSHNIAQVVTTACNQSYTLSVAVKNNGKTTIALSMDKDSAYIDYVYALYNLSTGVASSATNVGTASGASATMTYLGDGWYLCTLSGTPSTSAGTTLRSILHLNGIEAVYAGNGTSGVYLWGAQLETGTTASSRIDTSGTSATRASGVVYPQRLVLPASPVNDMIVQAMVANGIETNIVDPNGATIMGTNGPIQLDNPYASVTFQYSGSTWRMINA